MSRLHSLLLPRWVGGLPSSVTVLLAVFVALLSGSLGAAALASEHQQLSGRFELAEPEAAQKSRDTAVEAAAAEVPIFVRKMVEKRLRAAATVSPFVVLTKGDGSITISSERSAGWTTDLQRTEVEVVSADGKKAHLSRWMEGGVLHSNVRGENGTRASTLELSKDGQQLKVTTTIQPERLSRPLVFLATYRRVSPN